MRHYQVPLYTYKNHSTAKRSPTLWAGMLKRVQRMTMRTRLELGAAGRAIEEIETRTLQEIKYKHHTSTS